ncbi:MAG TPA: winged helix-turn-helix transcriptional regulator [Candidatus Acidoferrales bacterium]|nr:winged helix-turn-helix transcriptional regulator [Candidatus Acidoferrales bacterium]
MTLSRGTLEIIQLASKGPRSFKEFTEIEIGKRKLSSATVSKRLRELVMVKVLEEKVMRSEGGRKIVGYEVTERGTKILEMAKELDKAMHESEKGGR